ncbi:hypothetical protein DY000_02041095 [Brassica cretica]|uniref:Uncharacterized protein n=1 Tax=Brassica cretica TaxID=69181 RepID=A0ABQ7BMJ9_BRACR|nr:hypothetical protein DY000_02041095 [Brassica cretica]
MEEEAEGLTEEANRGGGGGGGGLGEVSSRECPLLVLRFRHGFSSGGFSPFARSLSSPVHSPASSREVCGVFISALVFAFGSPPMCWPELREYWIRFSDPDWKLRVASYESVGVARSLETRLKIDHPNVGISTWSLDVMVASAIDGKHSSPDGLVFCASLTVSVAMMMKSSGSSYSGRKTTRTAAVS